MSSSSSSSIPPTTPVHISATTRYILSTSGRPASLRRYTRLLQSILRLDIAYLPISHYSEEEEEKQGGGKKGKDEKIRAEDFISAIKGLNCIGGAISRDCKHSVLPFLDEIDPLAFSVSSVNTIIKNKKTGKLKGYNTDAEGFRIAIQEGMEELEKKGKGKISSACVYGYGGVSSVVFFILKSLGIKKIFVVGRRKEEAEKRAKEFQIEALIDEKTGKRKEGIEKSVDLFVNAAPIGEEELETIPYYLEGLKGAKMAFDHELKGEKLENYCRKNDILHIPGTKMYYPQMKIQWSLFLDGYCKPEEVEEKLKLAEKEE